MNAKRPSTWAAALQRKADQALAVAVEAYQKALREFKMIQEEIAAIPKEYLTIGAKKLTVEQRSAALGRSGDLIPALEIQVQPRITRGQNSHR